MKHSYLLEHFAGILMELEVVLVELNLMGSPSRQIEK